MNYVGIGGHEAKHKGEEQKIKFVETGLVELSIKVPGLLPENAKTVIREVRHGLENCGRLDLLDEFIETRTVEYREVPVEETN